MRMFTDRRILLFVLLQLAMGTAGAALEAVTEDGRRVRLLDDRTWEFIDAEAAESPAARITIKVTSKTDRQSKCIYGLRLQNDAQFPIQSLVPQFSAHVKSDVKYETVFVGFQRIKPTQNQYQELIFSRIQCSEITRIQVHGGDRCTMGELTKYSRSKGECLKQVKILSSPLVTIAK
jgi:hypothetical protein